jgi:hypothetical protein
MSHGGDVRDAIAQVFQSLGALTHAIGQLVSVFTGGTFAPHPHLKGGAFMFIVKNDQPDVPYSVGFVVKDAEGQVVPDAAVTVEVMSDNPDAVMVTPDVDNPRAGSAHFGNPGLANVNCTVRLADGTLVGSFGAQFTVTVGDPASIEGGAITFAGLTEAAPTPAPEPEPAPEPAPAPEPTP